MSLAALCNLRPNPDRDTSLARYRALAADYDVNCRRVRDIRLEAVDALQLKSGETVFDVACGTGPALPALAERVGAHGRVVGIEQSPDMARIARARIDESGSAAWVTVLVASVEEVPLDSRADALLFCYTHDVLQTPAAVAHLMRHARPGARVAVLATRFLPWWWGAPLNLYTGFRSRHYLTTFRGLSRPWEPLLPYCPDARFVRGYYCGTSCLAAGTVGG